MVRRGGALSSVFPFHQLHEMAYGATNMSSVPKHHSLKNTLAIPGIRTPDHLYNIVQTKPDNILKGFPKILVPELLLAMTAWSAESNRVPLRMDFTEINSSGKRGEILGHIDRQNSRFRTAKTILIKFGLHASFVELESAKKAVNELNRVPLRMDFTEINSSGKRGEILGRIDRQNSRFRTAKTILIKFGLQASFVELESAKNAVNESSISADGIGHLHIIDGIMNGIKYIDTIPELKLPPPIWDIFINNASFFQQDSASYHTVN
ncbi:hypothetical protein TNCV_2597051 [Trichonephila clavipes]|nr:hypothetical protein TNCV_2597051 [Trichonephila clavipes]